MLLRFQEKRIWKILNSQPFKRESSLGFMNKKALLGINLVLIIAAFVIGLFAGGYLLFKSQGFVDSFVGLVVSGNGPEGSVGGAVFCTEETKECPDGSYVSRNSSNNCEFDVCSTILDPSIAVDDVNNLENLEGEN